MVQIRKISPEEFEDNTPMAEQGTSPSTSSSMSTSSTSTPKPTERSSSERSSSGRTASSERALGATMAMSLEGPQPVPAEGSSVIHPPLIQGLAVPQEKDETTADDHDKATSRTEGEDPDESGVEKIWVQSGLQEPRVALWERDPSHPNGEAFVGPGETVEVAKTGAVVSRLAAGILKEGSKPS